MISLVSQIASAVDYAHSRGVIHRDIKPSNLILFEGERVKVTDFGIAKLVDAEMTQSGTLLGTPSYMSPEQAMGDKLDGRSDIFSLGVCAFEMLSGEQPFPGNNVTSILYKLVHVDPIEPANLEMNGLVPQKWHDVFGNVLAKKPDDRYQTATEFVQDLEYCLGSWFGAAMGDDTIAEGIQMAAVTTATIPPPKTATAAAPAPPAAVKPAAAPPPPKPAAKVDNDATTAMPAMTTPAPPPAPAAARAAVAPAPPPPAATADEEELPPTVHMKAPPADVVGKTVVMKAGQAQPTKPTEATTPGATVVMSASDVARPVSDATIKAPAMAPTRMEATVKEPIPAATVRAPAAPPPPKPTPPKPTPAAKAPAPAAPPPPQPPPPPAQTEPPDTMTAPAPIVPPPTRAARAGLSAGLILGVGALLFFLAIGVLILVLVRHRQSVEATPEPAQTPTPVAAITPSAPPPQQPTPSAAPPAAAGALHVESTPPGATVTVNGEAKGVTPVDVADLPLAAYDVKVELKGYQAFTQSVTLTAEQPAQELKAALKALGPAMGVADILSTPFGATVTVDGAKIGQTPVTDYRIKVGTHQVEIAKDGYEPQTSAVKIEPGKRARIDAQLRAIAKATPTPAAADVVDTSKVYLNSPSEVDTLARKVSGNSPSYPEGRAPRLRSGESVSASVSYVVTESGEVTDLRVVESGGKIVDDAVMSAIREWKYSPAAKKGVNVKVRITFKQTFKAG